MRKLIVHITVFAMTFLLTSFTGLTVNNNEQSAEASAHDISPLSIGIKQLAVLKASLLYDMLDLEEKGLSREAFEYAYKGYQQLVEKSLVTRPDYLTICDLSQSSKHKRFYLIDIINNRIILNTYVAHGKNSGGEYARKFSNKPESRQSSLGFYVTKNIYSGEHGVSLRVEGLEPGFNDRAYGRAIVIHGADYIGDGSAGRSYGCPAVPKDESKAIINMTKTEPVYLYTILKKNICKALKFLMADWTQTTRMDDN